MGVVFPLVQDGPQKLVVNGGEINNPCINGLINGFPWGYNPTDRGCFTPFFNWSLGPSCGDYDITNSNQCITLRQITQNDFQL